MKKSRFLLLGASVLLVLSLMGGGLLAKVGATEGAYRQSVLFAEVLSLVMENYVDPLDTDRVMLGAYEGMLGGLDPNGAFLTPEEVAEWKADRPSIEVGPGMTVLKAGRGLQVVAVEPGSSADRAGIAVGDQIRSVNGRAVRDLSLAQSRRLLAGAAGTEVRVAVLHPADEFSREELVLVRDGGRGPAYELTVEHGKAVLRLRRLAAIRVDELAAELDDIASRGVATLLVDLRYSADGTPEDAARLAALFHGRGTLFRLRDRAGRVVDSLDCPALDGELPSWSGSVALLVNGATADGAEALATLIAGEQSAVVYGESTYGLGARASLYELGDGSALLVPSAVWETADGRRWNESGIAPDPEVKGEGDDLVARADDQLRRVLELLDEAGPAAPAAAAPRS